MDQPPRVLNCKMRACYFYHNYPEGAEGPNPNNMAICHYPENDLIEPYKACAFYQMDWRKQLNNIPKKSK
jgi:hypothetical protein